MPEMQNIPDTADKGLAGVVAFTSEISAIVDTTLSYRGFTIEDLAAHSNFEETAFLLWHGHLPNEKEWQEWKNHIQSNYDIPLDLIQIMKSFPKTTTPMDALRTSVSALALWDPDMGNSSPEAKYRKSVRLLAKFPAIVAAWHRIRNGWEVLKPKPQLNIANNFFYLLSGKEADEETAKMFDTALVLHADHEMNASTFSARVTAATLSDVYSAITSAVGTLKGPLHGGANEQVMRMLERIGSVDKVDTWLANALEKKEKIMGFGHRVYKNGDPRAKILRTLSKDVCAKIGKSYLYEMSIKINEIMENDKGLLPNVDFYSASVYYCMGIPIDIFTPVFAMSRVSGWLAHLMEQAKNNRLIRPRSIYVGKTNQQWTPIAARS